MTWEQVHLALPAKGNGVLLADERLDAEPDALVGHQTRRRLVHQVAVLDALHARVDRPPDGGGRIGMHGDVSAAVGGSLHARAQFGLAEGEHIEGGARRRHAPAPDELDLRRALHELLAHPQAHFVGAVGDIGGASLFHVAYRPAGRARNVGERPQVAMAAGRGDHGAARIDARPGREALVDRLLERKRGAAQVPHRGEAAHERALSLGARGEKDVAELGRKQGRDRQRGENRVPVRVDQSGHHDPAATVDRPRSFRTCGACRRPGL